MNNDVVRFREYGIDVELGNFNFEIGFLPKQCTRLLDLTILQLDKFCFCPIAVNVLGFHFSVWWSRKVYR